MGPIVNTGLHPAEVLNAVSAGIAAQIETLCVATPQAKKSIRMTTTRSILRVVSLNSILITAVRRRSEISTVTLPPTVAAVGAGAGRLANQNTWTIMGSVQNVAVARTQTRAPFAEGT